eukprot:TRINITY_DN22115_c0_g1_i2.p1 TRINITY_DN22115_c0_g1~~TRINITY_DN22115_c0_g1_i2.p1  ORF type:complete len:290 (+),score=88.14 TRINITY_DN22115_c0_g1_i2:52-870(+)
MARLLFLPALFGRAAALSATLVQFDEASAFAVVRQDSGCFTQGLVWEPTVGVWYQSCGLPWQSNARQVSSDGDVLQQSALPSSEFAEGITIKDGHLYQLTWQSQRAYSYPVAARRGDAAFGGRQTLTYAGEGWGITTAPDGKLVVSNGTALLTFYDATPSSMAPVRTLLVTDDGEPVWQLNELEYVGDSIWANVWHSNRIAVIDPRTGAVSKWVDCTELVRRERAENGNAGVLNGIGLRDGVVWLTGRRADLPPRISLESGGGGCTGTPRAR